MANHVGALGDVIRVQSRPGSFDNPWTLIAIFLGYAGLNYPLQHDVWTLLAADRLMGGALMVIIFCASLAAVALAAYLAPTTSHALSDRFAMNSLADHRLSRLAIVALAVLLAAVTGFAVLDRFPNSGDEFAYLFQAESFAHGKLWAAAPPLDQAFVPYRTWVIGDKWLSQYPPGWPIALALGLLAGIPAWCLNALLGGALAATLLSRHWGFTNRRMQAVAALLLAMTPFYVMNAGSLYSHLLPALLISMLCLLCVRYQRDPRTALLWGIGALLGAIGLTRYFTLLLLLPAMVCWYYHTRQRTRTAIIVAIAGSPFLALLMLYQYEITGSAFKSTYALITNDESFLSFARATISLGIKLTLYRLGELSTWTAPPLLLAYLFCLAVKLKTRSLAFYDLVFPSFILGYAFFADLGGNRYGPRYYFDSYPLMLLTIVSATPLASTWARRLIGMRLAGPVVLTSIAYLSTALPFTANAYHRQVLTREEPYRLAAAEKLDNAVVVIETTSGRGLEMEDLARNDEHLTNRILFARAGTTISDLHNLFPTRSIWTYTRPNLNKPGRLDRIAGVGSVFGER